MIRRLFAYLLISCLAFISVAGIPTWEGPWGDQFRASIGSLVPGASYIEAIGPIRQNEVHQTKHLSVASPRGVPGNITVAVEPTGPPLFYIHQHQLYQITNETSILRVNVLNSTQSANIPLQLTLGNRKEGVNGGSWRWRGTMLHYDQGPKTNQGLFYTCSRDGSLGVYMLLEPSSTPPGCEILTLHSFHRTPGPGDEKSW